jgi:hypothetical protein
MVRPPHADIRPPTLVYRPVTENLHPRNTRKLRSSHMKSTLIPPATWSKIYLGGVMASAGLFVFFLGRSLFQKEPLSQPVLPLEASVEIAASQPEQRYQRAMPTPTESVSKRVVSVIEDPARHTELPNRLASKPSNLNAMNLNSVNLQRTYLYTFEGTATHQRKPCPDASIAIRITVGDKIQTVGGGTRPDGTYSITVPVEARLDQPVDWTIEAHTPDLQKAELVGRRIATEDTTSDRKITLQSTLALLPH